MINKLFKLSLITILCLFPFKLAHAQDSRLAGNWLLNAGTALPANTILTIEENPDRYDVFFSFPVALPAPLSCKLPAGQNYITLTPKGGINYSLSLFSFTPKTCAQLAPVANDVTIEFAESGNNFTSCAGVACLSWTRQGTPPGPISLITVPPSASPVGGKASISAAFLPVAEATGYRVSIKGPTSIARTVKKGLFTKFTGLAAGNYKVTYLAFFKDSKGKVQSTKSSLAIKVKVT